MKILPKIARVTLVFNPDKDHMTVLKYGTQEVDEQFEGTTAAIVLHNVVIDSFGNIHGTYIKPESLIHYDTNVDKTQFPSYGRWLLDNRNQVRKMNDNYDYKDRHWFVSQGLITDQFISKQTEMDCAFIQSRIPFGDNKVQIVLVEKVKCKQ